MCVCARVPVLCTNLHGPRDPALFTSAHPLTITCFTCNGLQICSCFPTRNFTDTHLRSIHIHLSPAVDLGHTNDLRRSILKNSFRGRLRQTLTGNTKPPGRERERRKGRGDGETDREKERDGQTACARALSFSLIISDRKPSASQTRVCFVIRSLADLSMDEGQRAQIIQSEAPNQLVPKP